MILDVGKIYDFFFSTDDSHWNNRGEVLAMEGSLVRIKDEHGAEEVVNLSHPHFASAREWKNAPVKSTVEFFDDD